MKNTAKKTALLLAFLALTSVGNAAFAQSVTGTDPVPGPYHPSPKSTATAPESMPSAAASTTSMTSVLMAFLLALQGA